MFNLERVDSDTMVTWLEDAALLSVGLWVIELLGVRFEGTGTTYVKRSV